VSVRRGGYIKNYKQKNKPKQAVVKFSDKEDGGGRRGTQGQLLYKKQTEKLIINQYFFFLLPNLSSPKLPHPIFFPTLKLGPTISTPELLETL
jgi:hypothetical protein